MASWDFNCIDNGGKRQYFTIKADTKTVAIHKAITKARANANGDITSWNCRLRRA